MLPLMGNRMPAPARLIRPRNQEAHLNLDLDLDLDLVPLRARALAPILLPISLAIIQHKANQSPSAPPIGK
jgi:hypothetical protein